MQRLCSTLHFTHRSSLHIAVFECALVPIQSGECGMTAWVRESSSRVSGQVSPKIWSKLNREIGQRFSDFGKVWRPIFTICGLRLLDPSARRARVNLLDITLVSPWCDSKVLRTNQPTDSLNIPFRCLDNFYLNSWCKEFRDGFEANIVSSFPPLVRRSGRSWELHLLSNCWET